MVSIKADYYVLNMLKTPLKSSLGKKEVIVIFSDFMTFHVKKYRQGA